MEELHKPAVAMGLKTFFYGLVEINSLFCSLAFVILVLCVNTSRNFSVALCSTYAIRLLA